MRILSNFAARMLGVPTIRESQRSLMSEFCLNNRIIILKKETSHRLNNSMYNPRLKEEVTFFKAKKDDNEIYLVTNYEEDLGVIEGGHIDRRTYDRWHILARDYRLYEKPQPYACSFYQFIKREAEEFHPLEPISYSESALANRKTDPETDKPIESKKIRFVCSSCHSASKIPAGIKGIVTCPKCSSTTIVEKDGTSAEKPIDKRAFDEAAYRYKKQKEENQQEKARLQENSKKVLTPPAPSFTPSEEERAARLAWLKENAEVFERRKAKGRVLNDYEQGLIDRYQAMLKEEIERSSIERNIAETDHPNTTGTEAPVEKLWNKNDGFQPNKRPKGINPIAVVGIGGCGCNSIENLATTEMLGIDFLSVDKWFESKSTALNVARITIGPDDPNTENMKRLATFISGRKHVVFIVGLGGNFGTLMLQQVANAVGNISSSTAHLVATLPFAFEGAERSKKAEKALARSVAAFSQVLVLKNQELFALADEKTTFSEAFRLSDDKIAQYLLQLG